MDKSYRKLPIQKRSHGDKEHPERQYYTAQISSGDLDSHYSRMSEGTLENFARDAERGVTILDSHNHRHSGVGKSVSGYVEDGKVFSDFYIVKDVNLQNASYSNTDDLIKMLEDGAVSDVSVGFFGHDEICNLCNDELWRGSCFHWPGLDYEVEENGEKVKKRCETEIQNGRLSEFSIVYDGALEGAAIVEKAERTKGRLSTRQKRHITDLYPNVKFEDDEPAPEKEPVQTNTKPKKHDRVPVSKSSKTLASNSNRGNFSMSMKTDQERIAQLEADNELYLKRAEDAEKAAEGVYEARARLKDLEKRFNESEDKVATLRSLHEAKEKEVTQLEEKVKDLTPKAEQFEVAKEDLIEVAMKARKGAFLDEDENHPDYKTDLAVLKEQRTLDGIKKFLHTWTKNRNDNFPGGENITKDPESDDTPPSVRGLPSKDSY